MSMSEKQAGGIRTRETPQAGQAETSTVSTVVPMENTFLDKKLSKSMYKVIRSVKVASLLYGE
jgi:hypothetical protein